MKKLFQNWKTTSAGLTLIGGSIIHLVFSVLHGTADEQTWTLTLGAIVGGVGLMFAGDAGKSLSKEEAATTFVTKAENGDKTKT